MLTDTAPPVVWADTIDEAVTVMHPRQVRLGRCPQLDVVVRLVATDADREWTLAHAHETRGDMEYEARGDMEYETRSDVEVVGPAAALTLLLRRRVRPDDPTLRIHGDGHALGGVLALRLTPWRTRSFDTPLAGWWQRTASAR
jgi:hypothetical protein